MIRKIVLLACCLLLPQVALGHTYLSWVSTDGTPQDEGGCVRPHPALFPENPLPLVTGPDMTCGWLPESANPAAKKCPIAAGGTIQLAWRHTSNSPTDDIIATTHKGPVLVYLAKSDTGAGPVWFKIYEDGYNPSTNMWGVDNLLANKGIVTATIPSDIAPGNYLVRGEIFALHNSYDINGVQPYVGCAELTISGSGTAEPSGVAIPGYYTPTDPGLYINIYQPVTSYVIPGPPLYKASSTPATAAPSPATESPTTAATPTPPQKAATSAPVTPTAEPTTKPTDTPTNTATQPAGASGIRVQLYPSSSEWWFATTVRSTPATTSIEFKDKGAYTTWTALQTTSWGYWIFGPTSPVVLPISLRITSESGVQVELVDVFSSWQATSFIDTGKSYDSSSPSTPVQPTSAPVAPTQAPVAPTAAPAAPTDAPAPPTAAPASPTAAPTQTEGNNAAGSIKLKFHEGSSAWWFAVAFTQNSQDITSVEIKDSATITQWTPLQPQSWGYYTFVTQGSAVVAPITFRLSGSVEFTINSLTPNTEINTNAQFA
jgi:cellulase